MNFLPKKYRYTETLYNQVVVFNNRLTAAEQMEQPADRLEALLELQSDISRHAAQMGWDFGTRAGNVEMATGLCAGIGGIVGGVVLTVFATPFVGVPVIVAGFAGLAVTDKVGDGMMKRMKKDASGHIEALKALSAKSGGDIADLLKNRAGEIAASEKFDSLYDRFPGIRNDFAKAFQKAVAQQHLAECKPEPSGPKPKLQL